MKENSSNTVLLKAYRENYEPEQFPDNSPNKKPRLTSASKMRAFRQRQRENVAKPQKNCKNEVSGQCNNIASTSTDSAIVHRKKPRLTSAEKTRAYRQRKCDELMQENSINIATAQHNERNYNSEQSDDISSSSTESGTLPYDHGLIILPEFVASRSRRKNTRSSGQIRDISVLVEIKSEDEFTVGDSKCIVSEIDRHGSHSEPEVLMKTSELRKRMSDLTGIESPVTDKCHRIKYLNKSDVPMRKNKALCCVPNCGKIMKPLIRFPKNAAHHSDWLRVIGNPVLKTKSIDFNYLYYRVCRKHFTEEAFNNSKCRRNPNILKTSPTLYLPVMKDDPFPNEIDLNDGDSNSTVLSKPSAVKRSLNVKHLPGTPSYEENSKNVQSNATKMTSLKMFSEPSKTESDPPTCNREIKSEPIDNEMVRVKSEEVLSDLETQVDEVNDTRAFAIPLTIKKECVEFESTNRNSCMMGEQLDRDDSDIFGKHVAERLRSYDQNTRTAVRSIFNKILIDADSGKYDSAISHLGHHLQ